MSVLFEAPVSSANTVIGPTISPQLPYETRRVYSPISFRPFPVPLCGSIACYTCTDIDSYTNVWYRYPSGWHGYLQNEAFAKQNKNATQPIKSPAIITKKSANVVPTMKKYPIPIVSSTSEIPIKTW